MGSEGKRNLGYLPGFWPEKQVGSGAHFLLCGTLEEEKVGMGAVR